MVYLICVDLRFSHCVYSSIIRERLRRLDRAQKTEAFTYCDIIPTRKAETSIVWSAELEEAWKIASAVCGFCEAAKRFMPANTLNIAEFLKRFAASLRRPLQRSYAVSRITGIR